MTIFADHSVPKPAGVPATVGEDPAPADRLRTADIVVMDEAGVPILIAEVKAQRRLIDVALRQQLTAYLGALPSGSFAMLVTPAAIQVFGWNGMVLSEPLCTLDTSGVLAFYDPEYAHKEVYEMYLTRLVEAWLRDVAYHWKSKTPPAYDELRALGITDRLRGGTTLAEAA